MSGSAIDELLGVGDWHTLALVVVVGGEVVHERYARGADASTPLVSWSMAKSVTHALVGLAVRDGMLDLDAPAAVPEWMVAPGDARAEITVQQLLEMRSGLRFVEDYVDAATSHCLEMLFGTGRSDVAAYAASQPLEHPPGSAWNYSSGTTNILARLVGDVVGGGREGTARWMRTELFEPAGMASADPRFDDAGTFIGSSFLWATARDFARFGALYLGDGVVNGRRVLPEGWVDHARRPVPVPAEERFGYGAHWWLWPDLDGFGAHGYEGQYTLVVPERDLVVVRLGKTPADRQPEVEEQLRAVVADIG